MSMFIEAFGDELEKLADASDTSDTYDSSAQGVQDAINSTQGRNKQLPGKIPSSLRQNSAQTVPPPETSPPSMQTYA